MTLITVEAPQTQPQKVVVHPRDYAEDARRYRHEANEPGLSEIERNEKISTADYLSHLALKDEVKRYSGNTNVPPAHR